MACASEPARSTVSTAGARDAAVAVDARTRADAADGDLDAGAQAAPGADAAPIAVGSAPLRLQNYVFVTSKLYDADFGSPSAADAFCNEVAADAKLPGQYVAWLSTTTVDAAERLPETSGGWARTDGLPFAASASELLAGAVLYPPRLDEQRSDLIDLRPTVFTGTTQEGTRYSGGRYDHCADWTSRDASLLYRGGTPAGGTLLWTEGNGGDCAIRAGFYCFGIDDALDLTVTPREGRLAFVSEAELVPGSGLDGADALCQAEADASKHAGTFKALLAGSTHGAAERFADGETWVRPDGVAVVEQASDLLAARTLLAPITQQADGEYVSTVGVWSGASDVVTRGTAQTHCDDWTSSSGMGNAGMAGYSSSAFFDGQAADCSVTYYRVYCLQE